ncbi:MAG: hypothetical protein ACOYYU_04930 [Chloroflexota bacterium]
MKTEKALRRAGILILVLSLSMGCNGTPAAPTPTAAPTLPPTPALAAVTPAPAPAASGFFVGGQPFTFLGAFVPGWYWGQRSEQTDIDLLQSARQAGFTVLHVMPPIIDLEFGKYNEAEFQKLDFFLDQAGKQGLRVMIPFIHGLGMTQPGYGAFYHPFGIQALVKDPAFKDGFLLHMQAMVERVNSVNGKVYAQDPTIMGWLIIEEPISGPQNYPQGPPDVTWLEVRAWLDEMATALKTMDPNHPVGINLTASIEGSPELEDKAASLLEIPSLDFLEMEDGDVRVLQQERSNHLYDLAFETGKPVIMYLSFTGMSYPDPGQFENNMERMMEICHDYDWQAQTLYDEFNAYREKGAAGYIIFSWRSALTPPPEYDQCFSYSQENQPVVASLQTISQEIGAQETPGFVEIRPLETP